MFRTGRLKPASQIDGCGNDKSVVIECFADVCEGTTISQVQVQMVVPQFDGIIAGGPGSADLLQDRSCADGTGVEAVTKSGHG
jgi:hypothetical protein